ncbi:Fibrillarin-like rRNA/tRNA 2'-O-methyltransferase [Candidatus Gugararchaeum adminiculabundum]|nr:Fibrillarin-like rRNA/tRNA 2'-O-methyltransferase [Candidatus Gugararchaeum adminiculabundum]
MAEKNETLEKKFPGVYLIDGRQATKSLAPGFKVYDERVAKLGDVEYRMWDVFKSKLSAAIKKGLKELPVKPGCTVLYLGAASGTTASHVSDIVGAEGGVYCVEFAPRSMRDLVLVCEKRENMLPILGDARRPEEYAEELGGDKVDVVYEDVAQPDQAEILIKNCENFLKPKGHAMIAIKSQSIDVTKNPLKVYEEVKRKLSPHFEILQEIDLDPYDKEHLFLSLRAKK